MSSPPSKFDFVICKQHLYNGEKLRKLAHVRLKLKEQSISDDLFPTTP